MLCKCGNLFRNLESRWAASDALSSPAVGGPPAWAGPRPQRRDRGGTEGRGWCCLPGSRGPVCNPESTSSLCRGRAVFWGFALSWALAQEAGEWSADVCITCGDLLLRPSAQLRSWGPQCRVTV